MSGGTAPLDASVLTLSFSGDFAYCGMLCESVDRFVAPAISHRLFVPTRDLALFAPLAGPRRTIGSQDRDLLPRWLWKLPLPEPRLRKLLCLPRRNIYLSPFGPPVRGWIAQQIMKIAACADSPTEIIMHMDSDGVFIRPLRMDALLRPDGKVRFYRDPKPSDLATHRLWRETAHHLLGLRPNSIEPGDYIGLCVVWRRSIVRRMIERIEEVGGGDWRKILARMPNFSEYTLYGLFVESLGIEASGHFVQEVSPVHCVWEEALAGPEAEAEFTHSLRPEHFACLIQSTVAMDLDARRRLFERVAARAQAQDRSASGTDIAADHY